MSTTKSIRVYDILPSSVAPTGVWFVQPDDDEPGTFKSSFRLELDTWRNMGEPATLTLTIQPGDLLNGPDAIVDHKSDTPGSVRRIDSGVSAGPGETSIVDGNLNVVRVVPEPSYD